MRIPLVAGNWKMNRTPQEGARLAHEIMGLIRDVDPGSVEVLVCPPYPALMDVACVLEGTYVALGAQDLHHADEGPYTGGVSGGMLAACGCRYVLVGHSERRTGEGETVELTGAKLDAAFRAGLIPVLCVGERADARAEGATTAVIGHQLGPVLELDGESAAGLVVAYEPVWAIGSGSAASPGDAGEVAEFIRCQLEGAHGPEVASAVRILYGGSVGPDNVRSFLDLEDVDGVLVGGASLDGASFASLVEVAGRVAG